MRLFGKKKVKHKAVEINASASTITPIATEEMEPIQSPTAKSRKGTGLLSSLQDPLSTVPTLAMVPKLVHDLASAKETSGEKPAKALRMLFALSEHSSDGENRIQMVRVDGAKIVPVLLDFLNRCARGSSEQYLALLVINNVSIPSENKRLIAMDCGGARIFSRLLCEDPSCHLMAIILVNLTFSDAELRKEMVALNSNIKIVESLAYASRVASLTHAEYESREPWVAMREGTGTVMDLLSTMMDEDRRLRLTLSNLDCNRSSVYRGKTALLDPAKLKYPETARWCLSAIKNLTRPSKESQAANTLIKTGIIPLILKLVTVGGIVEPISQIGKMESIENHRSQSSSSHSPTPVAPTGDDGNTTAFNNSPIRWDSNSMQDAALYIILNLTTLEGTRDFVRNADGVYLLTQLAEYRQRNPTPMTLDEGKQLDFQCLKAKIALAYIIGSEGNYGQTRAKAGVVIQINPNDSVILLSDNEVFLMIELLANTLSQRSKDGPGGYSAATFNVKWVLFAVHCFLTQAQNQLRFLNFGGAKLNTLLLKALALHAIKNMPSIDTEAAEYASFSLYLQSNYGFTTNFLPAIYGNKGHVAGNGSLAAKVLTTYVHMENTTPAGRHAAEQLLLRLRYLKMSGSLRDLVHTRVPSTDDYSFGEELTKATDSIIVEKRSHGARPRIDIFDRPVLRSRAPKKGNNSAPWDSRSSVSIYPSALLAVQHLSFGSTKVRHMDAIDDIAIANNIASSANGEKTESYNYWWSWQDAAGEIQKNLERQRSMESSSLFSANIGRTSATVSEPMTIFGFQCGSLCAADTTTSEK